MAKKFTPDQIYTPEYCTAVLEDGSVPQEKFCSACGEVVYDVSKMTRREFEKLRANRVTFCGKTEWIDGELQFAPDPHGARARLSQVALAAALVLPAAACDSVEKTAVAEPPIVGNAEPGAASPIPEKLAEQEARAEERLRDEFQMEIAPRTGEPTESILDQEQPEWTEELDDLDDLESTVDFLQQKRNIRQKRREHGEPKGLIGIIRGDD